VRWPAGCGTWTRAVGALLLLAWALGPRALGAAGVPDRLERFRELALSRQRVVQLDVDGAPDTDREMLALVDEEIVENLATGGPFASTAFLQDRLDAFGDAWGAAALSVVRVDRVVVGAFQLSDAPGANTVRIYGRFHGQPALLSTIHRDGRPSVYPLPPAPGGAPQFLAAWEGAASGRGTRALRLDLVRQEGDGVRVAWTTADVFDGPLLARSYHVHGGEIRVRYELHYTGWTPGCAGQTEAEDVFRLGGDGTVVRVSRTYHDGWHRDLHETVARLFAALAAGETDALARLVPDARLRDRLPASLRPEPACDAAEGSPASRTVSVAASRERSPWELVFRRARDGWRLVRAAPVLE